MVLPNFDCFFFIVLEITLNYRLTMNFYIFLLREPIQVQKVQTTSYDALGIPRNQRKNRRESYRLN